MRSSDSDIVSSGVLCSTIVSSFCTFFCQRKSSISSVMQGGEENSSVIGFLPIRSTYGPVRRTKSALRARVVTSTWSGGPCIKLWGVSCMGRVELTA